MNEVSAAVERQSATVYINNINTFSKSSQQ